MSELMKEASKEAYGQGIKGKMYSTVFVVYFWLSLRFLNIINLYVHTVLKKNRTKMLKSLWMLEKGHLDDTIVYVSNIIEKYKIDQITYIHCA